MAVVTVKGLPVVCNFGGKYTLPSVVIFSSESVYIWHAAVQHEDLKRPKNTILSVKCLKAGQWLNSPRKVTTGSFRMTVSTGRRIVLSSM